MKVAVTGASGFIGGHLVAALRERGDAVVTPGRAELGDPHTLAEEVAGSAAIVHLAGGGASSEKATWEANLGTTERVVGAAREAGVPRVLLASTVTVTREKVAAYGASKRAAEEALVFSGLEWTLFRFAFVYGRGESGVFAQLVGLARRLPMLPVVGSGRLDIAPVHVDDVVAAIVAALDLPDVAQGKTYTIAGPEATLDDVLQGVYARLGKPMRLWHLPRPVALFLARIPGVPLTRDNVLGMTQEASQDPWLAQRDLGFEPRPLAAGLDDSL